MRAALSRLSRRCALALALAALTHTAYALPREARVPGGIALIPLGERIAGAAAPVARLGEQPLWVTTANGQWIAVVGLALDLAPGSLAIDVDDGEGERRSIAFAVQAKDYPVQRIRLKDTSRVTLADDDARRAVAEIAAIGELKRHWRASDTTDDELRLPAPGRLASRFGLRRVFNGEPRAPHSGLDLAVARGTPVGASADGIVLAVDDYFFNGQTVFVDHGNGLITMYCHLERIDVRTGDAVRQGQAIGRSGMSGRASGPHLHWSVLVNGAAVDPELFLAAAARR